MAGRDIDIILQPCPHMLSLSHFHVAKLTTHYSKMKKGKKGEHGDKPYHYFEKGGGRERARI